MKVAVVGKGLIGSAAARHLAKAGHDVTLIGPDEVAGAYADHKGSFASHYDEGRITRKNDRRAYFTRVSTAAISRYPEIAAESGIEFFTQSGAMLAGGPDYMAPAAWSPPRPRPRSVTGRRSSRKRLPISLKAE